MTMLQPIKRKRGDSFKLFGGFTKKQKRKRKLLSKYAKSGDVKNWEKVANSSWK